MQLNVYKKKLLIWGGAGFALFLVSYFIFNYLAKHPSTDDAYVQADTINVAAQVTGPVDKISVRDHQVVTQGQLLFTIDPRPFQIALDQATATVAGQRAALIFAEQNAERILKLVASGQASKSSGDQVKSQLETARAQLLASEAQQAKAQLDLEHTKIVAPSAGIVTQFVLQPGNNVIANTTLFMIVEQDHCWVDANFKETQIAHIKSGQPVKIKLDMYPKHTFTGVVDAVSSASGSVFSLLPPENASGNWVKVTQRFPVKILINNPDPAHPLRAGATATATVDTTRM